MTLQSRKGRDVSRSSSLAPPERLLQFSTRVEKPGGKDKRLIGVCGDGVRNMLMPFYYHSPSVLEVTPRLPRTYVLVLVFPGLLTPYADTL